jgi:peroxiredoxin
VRTIAHRAAGCAPAVLTILAASLTPVIPSYPALSRHDAHDGNDTPGLDEAIRPVGQGKDLTMAITLEAGDAAPAFSLEDQDGKVHRLEDYRGQTVVLYFYPKDDTPGCTKEACSFRDNHAAIQAAGAVVLGVSADSAASHQKFREKYSLPFPLLVDDGAKVSSEYGAWGEKVLYGKTVVGMTRSTFIIGPDGHLTKVWKRAKAEGHGEQVLKALTA